jgi:hypothetical protein
VKYRHNCGLLKAVVTPAEIQQAIDLIQNAAREELIESLQQYGVPQAVLPTPSNCCSTSNASASSGDLTTVNKRIFYG